MDRETGGETEKTGQAAPLEVQEQARATYSAAPRPVIARAADPRMRIWVRRAAMAVVAGFVVAIWQDWRLGLTAAALVAIADTIYRSKTMAVIPEGARATSAQRRTRRRLFLLRQAGYFALHARAIPGSNAIIDHLVIGPAGVYALDSERWDRRLPVRTVGGTLLYHGPINQKKRLLHARWEAEQASTLVGAELEHELEVRPAMAIYGPTIPWGVTNLRGVDVFGGRRVGKYFRRQTRNNRKQRLSPAQIDAIVDAATRALPPAR
jgi:hypothetical protein